MNARLTFITLLIYVSVAMAIFLVVKNSGDDPVYAAVFPRVLIVGDVLTYRDSTPNAKSYVWEFGNGTGNKKFKANGTYRFLKPGSFLMRLTINNKLADTFRITVNPKPVDLPVDSSFTIYAPKTAYIRENIQFKALGGHMEAFKWSFGESEKVDSREEVAFHSYSRAGKFEVKLTTNFGIATHKIEIIDPTEPPPEGPPPPPDLKGSIQKLAGSGDNFNKLFNSIVGQFLCGNKRVPILVNGKNADDFYLYASTELRGDASKRVDDAKTESDPRTNCISKLILTVH